MSCMYCGAEDHSSFACPAKEAGEEEPPNYYESDDEDE